MTPSVNIDTTVIQSLPFSKRLQKWILFVQSVCYPVKWLYNNVLTGYMTGTVTANYVATGVYNTGQQVIYNYGVWESTVNGNLGNTPSITPAYAASSAYAPGNCTVYNGTYYLCNTPILTGEAFNAAHWTALVQPPWIPVNSSFIGAKEMAHYGGGRLTLEWALNRYFQTTFRQPDSAISPTPSEYYISDYVPPYTSFVSYTTETLTSDVYTTGDMYYSFTTEIYTGEATYGFVVHIPGAVYTAINPSPAIADTVIRQFLGKYVVNGVVYSITTY